MDRSFIAPTINTAPAVPHEHAVKLAKMHIEVARDNGIRSDRVGIEAMCILAGLRDEPAIMPTTQAIRYVNLVTGQVPRSKNNGNGRSSNRSRPHRN